MPGPLTYHVNDVAQISNLLYRGLPACQPVTAELMTHYSSTAALELGVFHDPSLNCPSTAHAKTKWDKTGRISILTKLASCAAGTYDDRSWRCPIFVGPYYPPQPGRSVKQWSIVSVSPVIEFEGVGRLPTPEDNVAIACRTLEQGTQIACKGATLTLSHTILEGHRFAVQAIRKGEQLLSWGLPFGLALTEIKPGDYVCNEWILIALRQRHVKFELPQAPNFENHRIRYQLDPQRLNAGKQVERYAQPGTFKGFDRGARGVGTRNFIVVLGTSSRTASYARALAERFRSVPSKYANIDGVAAIAHTEGGGTERPNNLDFVLRTLAGFVVHPNVGAVLAVDVGNEAVTNHLLHAFMCANNYPVNGVTHDFLSMTGSFEEALARGESTVRGWLPEVDQCRRTTQPLEKLRIALQCGGSDAFSGVSANPLLGLVAKELVRHGGSANLAETDELIGAEPYVLSNVRDVETARAFLNKIERFQERASWHGETAEGNPSGGNNFRGLYNITVKSIGAARKKDPELRLDYVIDYAQPMTAPGFYFMDSPGNDLEGIAGPGGGGLHDDFVHDRERVDYEFSVRADDEDHDEQRALQHARAGDGRERGAVSGWHADGDAGPRDV